MTIPRAQSSWRLAEADPALVAELASATGHDPIVARVLVARGVSTPEAVRAFLEPSLESAWLDPELIPGMTEAADAVARAVREGTRIVVFGDFDLDGVSSAAVATRGLAALGAAVSAIVPHRFREGYGLSDAALERVWPLEPGLLITVDCGVGAEREVALLRERGIDVVVTDHHEPGEGVPAGVPVANPKLGPGDTGGCELAGAGVALKLVHAVGRRLGREDAWRALTDLATLGTIADVVPLVGENRALVAHGIALMRSTPRVALSALAAVAGAAIDTLSAESVAFGLAPRLNAAGRMADPALALDLLLTDDPVRAEELSIALDEHNRMRQSVEADLAEAATALAERTYGGERGLVLAGEGWHEGVKGIVASRLVSTFGVPTILFAIEDGVARGSGRSVGSVDLYRALEACADLLTRFGGHAGAVGLALPAQDIPAFRDRFLGYLATLPAEQFASATAIDAEVRLEEMSVELGAEMALLEPFGHANRRPLLVARDVFMNGRQRVGRTANHLRFTAFDGTTSVPAISFRCRDLDRVSAHEGAADVAFELAVDEWRGRTRVQLMVRDISLHEVSADAPAGELVEDLFARADEILAREEYAGIGDAPSFHTKLAGVTFEGRQDVLARLAAGTPLRLVRQPDNEFDPAAIALFDPHGEQVGYLNRKLAAVLAPLVDSGVDYDVEATEVTGGQDGASFGVNVLVSRRELVEDDAESAAMAAARRAELSSLSPEALEAALASAFIGERSLHAAQVDALAALARGENTLAVMATGRGKSLIFHLHAARTALQSGRASVFVYPLRALVADQAFHLEEAFGELGITVRVVTGETSQSARDEAFSALAEGGLDVVLTTPEFLHFHAERFAAAERVGFVVVDEAHHVGLARAGHRPAYALLCEALTKMGSPRVLAVTATADDATAETIRATLGIDTMVLDPTVRENLRIEDRRDRSDKEAALAALVASGEKTVVYVNSREQSVKLARMLRKRLPALAMRTAFYNGGLSRSVRHAVERAFRRSELSVVIATSAFGEGVNIPDIRNVVLFHLPFNDVEFNQMAGRAGRDGAIARIHLMFGGRDARINEMILASLAPERDDLAALYVVLRELQNDSGAGFEVTNAELAERCRRKRPGFGLDERGVSSALGILRDLSLLTGEGHGAYRRLTLVPSDRKVDLTASVRYAEGMDEIEGFSAFKCWALSASPDELLARFNRPILPRHP